MKNLSKFALVFVLILATAIMFNSLAYSGADNSLKIAVVDVKEIAVKYPKVVALQKAQQAKLAGLQKFVDDANREIKNEKDAAKRKQLEAKYKQELAARKKAVDEEYKNQLAEIDKNMMTVVGNIAKTNKYDYVLAKNAVLYGGKNITGDVLKSLK
jgi:outer membrane protein